MAISAIGRETPRLPIIECSSWSMGCGSPTKGVGGGVRHGENCPSQSRLGRNANAAPLGDWTRIERRCSMGTCRVEFILALSPAHLIPFASSAFQTFMHRLDSMVSATLADLLNVPGLHKLVNKSQGHSL